MASERRLNFPSPEHHSVVKARIDSRLLAYSFIDIELLAESLQEVH